MEPTPWYQSAIVRQQIVQIIVAVVALLGIKTGGIDIDGTVASIFAGIAGLIGVWTLVTRIFKPSPNLTQTAANKEVELKATGKFAEVKPNQSGFARLGLLLSISIGGLLIASALPGCAGTQAAYKSAESLPETAYVVAEHYAAVVHEAANLAALPTTPAAAKDAMKAADAAVKPWILGDGTRPGLRDLAQRYQDVKSAQTELELQAAINSAVLELTKLINAVKAARR